MDGRFSIPLPVVNRAVREGIPFASFKEMITHSARITHPDGNRRFHNYLFQVTETGKVVNFKRVDEVVPSRHVVQVKEMKREPVPERPRQERPRAERPQVRRADFKPQPNRYREPLTEVVYNCAVCSDTRKVLVYDECSQCEGEGCQLCESKGEVKRFIPCQACALKEKLRAHG